MLLFYRYSFLYTVLWRLIIEEHFLAGITQEGDVEETEVDPVGHVTKVKEIKMEPPQAMKEAQAVLHAG